MLIYMCMLDSPFVSGTHIIISSQVADVEMTVHIGFVNLGIAVTIDDDIFNQVPETKMAVHIEFVNLCTAVATDDDISSQVAETNRFFFIPCTQDKTIKENQYETNSKENPV